MDSFFPLFELTLANSCIVDGRSVVNNNNLENLFLLWKLALTSKVLHSTAKVALNKIDFRRICANHTWCTISSLLRHTHETKDFTNLNTYLQTTHMPTTWIFVYEALEKLLEISIKETALLIVQSLLRSEYLGREVTYHKLQNLDRALDRFFKIPQYECIHSSYKEFWDVLFAYFPEKKLFYHIAKQKSSYSQYGYWYEQSFFDDKEVTSNILHTCELGLILQHNKSILIESIKSGNPFWLKRSRLQLTPFRMNELAKLLSDYDNLLEHDIPAELLYYCAQSIPADNLERLQELQCKAQKIQMQYPEDEYYCLKILNM